MIEGAIEEAGWDRTTLVDARAAAVLLDTVAMSADGALAGARVDIDEATGAHPRGARARGCR